MSVTREQIMTAFGSLVFNAGPFKTTGRRVQMWNQVSSQPAAFVRNIGDKYERHGALPPKITMMVEIWLYDNSAGVDPNAAPGAALNALVDAVEAALAPDSKVSNELTLGGLVTRCRIEGECIFDPGDLDGQAKAVIPVHILVPSFT